MFLYLTFYLLISVFGGTIWQLRSHRDTSIVRVGIMLILFQLIFLIILFVMLISEDINIPWLAPIICLYALLVWALIVVISLICINVYRRGLIREYFINNGLRLCSYSLIIAICIFFLFISVVGIIYEIDPSFKIEGLSNLIGIAGIITTLLGILVSLIQLLRIS